MREVPDRSGGIHKKQSTRTVRIRMGSWPCEKFTHIVNDSALAENTGKPRADDHGARVKECGHGPAAVVRLAGGARGE